MSLFLFLAVRKARITTVDYSGRSSLVQCYSHSYKESLRMCLTRILLFTFGSIKMSLGLQEFQPGIITEDTMGQVPQLVAAKVPTKISLKNV